MSIDEQIKGIANEFAANFGTDHVITLQELYSILMKRYGTKEGSIIPSDYCYNRVNKGITLKKPTVFEFLGNGNYRCLGSDYPYNGNIYHKPKGQEEFIVGKCVNGERIIAFDQEPIKKETDKSKINGLSNSSSGSNQTSRNPGMKLRFEVLKRDNFKCRVCGASPAKDPMAVLHVDHIVPWSKGGETVIDNLQTLCSMCNFGKSNNI